MVVFSEKEKIARNKLCLPLDVDSSSKAINLVKELSEHVGLFKVGKELFTNEGAGRTITTVKDQGADKPKQATPDEMRANAYTILQDMAKNL